MSENGDESMPSGEEDTLLNYSDQEENSGDIKNLEIEAISDAESENEEDDTYNLESLEGQFGYKTKRRQKLRVEAKNALVDKYATIDEFKVYLQSK